MEVRGNTMSNMMSSEISDNNNEKYSLELSEPKESKKEMLKQKLTLELKKPNFKTTFGDSKSDMSRVNKKNDNIIETPNFLVFEHELEEIIQEFYFINGNNEKVEKFKRDNVNEQKIEVLWKITKDFPNFSVLSKFDEKTSKKLEKKYQVIRRNNFVILLLIKLNELKIGSVDNIISELVKLNLYTNFQNKNEIYLEVEFFFLLYFGYKQFVLKLLMGNLDFINLTKNNQLDNDSCIKFFRNFNPQKRSSSPFIETDYTNDLNIINNKPEEILFIREVIIGCIKRRLFEGLL